MKTSSSLGRELIRVLTSFLIDGMILMDLRGLSTRRFLRERIVKVLEIKLKAPRISKILKNVKNNSYHVIDMMKSIIFQASQR